VRRVTPAACYERVCTRAHPSLHRPTLHCQVARQEGQYLASLLSKNQLAVAEPAGTASEAADGTADADLVPLPAGTHPFGYTHLGSLAYLGDSKGAMDLPVRIANHQVLRRRSQRRRRVLLLLRLLLLLLLLGQEVLACSALPALPTSQFETLFLKTLHGSPGCQSIDLSLPPCFLCPTDQDALP